MRDNERTAPSIPSRRRGDPKPVPSSRGINIIDPNTLIRKVGIGTAALVLVALGGKAYFEHSKESTSKSTTPEITMIDPDLSHALQCVQEEFYATRHGPSSFLKNNCPERILTTEDKDLPEEDKLKKIAKKRDNILIQAGIQPKSVQWRVSKGGMYEENNKEYLQNACASTTNLAYRHGKPCVYSPRGR